jgi:hypothetical protein
MANPYGNITMGTMGPQSPGLNGTYSAQQFAAYGPAQGAAINAQWDIPTTATPMPYGSGYGFGTNQAYGGAFNAGSQPTYAGMAGMPNYPSTAASTTPQPQPQQPFLPTAPSMIAYPAQQPAPVGASGPAMGDFAMAPPAPLPPFGSPFQFFPASQVPQQQQPQPQQQGFPGSMGSPQQAFHPGMGSIGEGFGAAGAMGVASPGLGPEQPMEHPGATATGPQGEAAAAQQPGGGHAQTAQPSQKDPARAQGNKKEKVNKSLRKKSCC